MSTALPPDPAEARPSPIVVLTPPERSPLGELPLPLTSFVGREREVAAVAALLNDLAVRLVTLTGPGGVGKTRLALRVAEELVGSFPDGVWFVPLAPVRDPALVADAVAGVLGVRETASRTLVAGLQRFLRDKQALLVLDNVEHVLDAAPLVTDLLAACPRLTVLATSRAALRLSGEHGFAVPPLALPDLADLPPLESLSETPAVRLFVERARAARADFALTAENAAAVTQVCHRLDGLPLAIELAAARVAALPLPALLARLDRRLALLTGGARDQPLRLRTMRDAIAWSHDLLTPAEQVLFRRLSVFVGGCTLEAAEDIAGEAGLDVLDGITSLVNKGLLGLVDASGGSLDPGAPRYGMLETVREFGLEQLAAAGEEEVTRRAQAAWCVDLAEQSWESLVSLTFYSWMARVAADYDNLRAALTWLEQTGDAEGMLRLAGSLGEFWLFYGHRQEGRGWLERALGLIGSTAIPATVRARALRVASMPAMNRGDYEQAIATASESLSLWRDLGDRQGTALALHLLGLVTLHQGNYAQAAAHGAEAEAIFAALGNPWWAAGMRSDVIGPAVWGQGDPAAAAAILEESLAMFRELGDPLNTAITLNYLGFIACDRGDHAAAAARFAEGLPLWRQLGTRETQADWLAGVATLAAIGGAPERAARFFGGAEALRDSVGHAFLLPERETIDRGARGAQAALGDADFAAAWSGGNAVPTEQGFDEATAFLASVLAPAAPAAPRSTGHDAGLTRRERDVLRLLVAGRSDKEIAAALFIGMRTVQSHTEHLYAKLGVRNRHEATAVAVHRGLV